MLYEEEFSAEAIERFLPSACPFRITVVDESESTNSAVKALAEGGEPEGYVLIADLQTHGKGRLGRSFYSPAGTGLYLSVLLRPDLPALRAVGVTTVAAVAASRAVKRVFDADVGIKWVNDLYLDGCKVCGILTESSVDFETGRLQYAVCGIGFNVFPPPGGFPPEMEAIAGVLSDSFDRTARARLAAAFLSEFYSALQEDKVSVMEEYRHRSILMGRSVVSLGNAFPGTATVLGVDDDGGLIVRLSDGTEKTLSSGEVSVRLYE